MTRRTLWLSLLSAGLALTAVAQQSAAPQPMTPVPTPGQTNPQNLDFGSLVQMISASSSTPSRSSDEKFPDFKEVTKDMTSQAGLFTLWFYSGGEKDPEKLLAQIPSGLLGEQFMLSTSVSGGGYFTGFPLDERVVRWELMDKQLLLVQPETQFVVNQSKEVADVVRRTHPDRIRVAVPLVTKAPNGDPVIDLGSLLKSEFADIGWTGGGGINPQLSKWTTKKSFELNVEIGVALAVSSGSPPGSYDKKMVHYSFWKLPQTDYQPRIADQRVGYFLTANVDWAKPVNARELFNRYIDRWHLVKRDPSLDLCEPKQPIIFYIEKTVPVQYRRAVRDGIAEWNKAYEKCGFLNAVEVRQQTDDNEWKDLDPEDMRYSFFRWIVTGQGFAMGPHRANPFTGQIYDADIIMDDSMVRFYEKEAQMYMPSTARMAKFDDPALARLLELNPAFRPAVVEWRDIKIGADPDEPHQHELMDIVKERMLARGRPCCEYAAGMQHQIALGQTMLAGQPKEVVDRFLYDVIKEVVMHEVGHTLGLRHNFKASTIYTLDQINARRGTGEPTTGSVMDYNPALLFSTNPTEGHFITPTLGPYDYWAIEYGYRPFDGKYQSKNGKKSDEDKKGDEQKDGEKTAGEKPKADAKPDVVAIAQTVKIDASQVPPEVLAQMPPEMRQALESGNMAKLIEHMSDGGNPTTATKEAEAPTFATPPADEAGMLADIAGRAAEPELVYASDEDTTFVGCDPRVNRFDLGADPMEAAVDRIKLVDERLKSILDWAVKDKEPWYYLRSTFLTLMAERATIQDYVGRYIGGIYFARNSKGDPNAGPPFALVEADKQRAALKFIADRLYSDEFFTFSPEVLNHLAPPRWWHTGTSISVQVDFPLYEYISTMQWWNLYDRLFPLILARLHDNELRTTDDNKLTVAEYLQTLQHAVWHDAVDAQRLGGKKWTDAQPFVSGIRRSLQREYLGLVEPMVRQRPGGLLPPDLQALLQFGLKDLSKQLAAVADSEQLDYASRAHLAECKSRIDRMLAAELREFDGMSGGMSFMMQDAGARTAPAPTPECPGVPRP